MDIFDILKAEHVDLKRWLHKTARLARTREGGKRQGMEELRRVRLLLTNHMIIEERLLYPVMHPLAAMEEFVENSYREHQEISTLLDKLLQNDLERDAWIEEVQRLSVLIEAHVRQEESILFGTAQEVLSTEELDVMGKRVLELKESGLIKPLY